MYIKLLAFIFTFKQCEIVWILLCFTVNKSWCFWCKNKNYWNDVFIIQGCGTKDGPESDANPDPYKACVFPFQYSGTSYQKCTTKYTKYTQPWCATEVDANGGYIEGKWGICDECCSPGAVDEQECGM